MTIRMIGLSLLTMLGLAAGIVAAPQPSFAEGGRGDHRGAVAREQAQERRGERNEDRKDRLAPVDRAELRDELMKLPPEQRREKIEEIKQQMNEGRAQKLEERKAEFQQKWDNASPEQRVKFCGNVRQKCASGERGAEFACAVARNKCEGQ